MSKANETGAVLITTLFITALAALLAASIAFREHLFFSSSQGIRQWQQAYQTFQWVSAQLSSQIAKQSQSAPIQYFKPLKRIIKLNDQDMTVAVIDAQGRYNINLLSDAKQIPIFKQLLLFNNPTCPPELAQNFSQDTHDWLQNHTNPATDAYYLRLKPAYYPSHDALTQLSELKLIRHYRKLKLSWQRLKQNIIALPSSARVNRYDASPQLLATLYPAMTEDRAEAYLACVKSSASPNTCDGEFVQDLSSHQPNATVNQTHYFLIQAIVNRKKMPALYFASLIHIQHTQNNQDASVIWQRFSED